MRRFILLGALVLLSGTSSGPLRAEGPRLDPAQAERMVAEHLAAPRHYDIFFGKRDRQYLTGIWKLRWVWNFLTKEWMKENLVEGGLGTAPSQVLREGHQVPYREVEPGEAELSLDADVSDWWDVLVPDDWHRAPPGESFPDRRIADTYNRGKRIYFFGGVGFYRKRFFVPREKRGRRVVLHFESVESLGTIWVNGQEVGRHRNLFQRGVGRVPAAFLNDFEVEITPFVRFGEWNLLTVRIYDSGLPIMWGMPDSGGITGPVWLEYFPPFYFQRVLITAPYGAERLTADLLPAKPPPGGSASPPRRLRVVVRPWQSEDYRFPGPPREWKCEVTPRPGAKAPWWRIEVPVPGIEAWSPERPCLYEFRLLDAEGQTMALERFGVRRVEVQGNRILLNGRPVYFFGLNSGASILGIGEGNAETPGRTGKEGYNFRHAARRLLQALRAANFTSIRVHTGPNYRLAYHLCDEVGLMVRDEWTPQLRTFRAAKPFEQRVADYQGPADFTGAFRPDGKGFVPALEEKLLHWLEMTWNSPSLVTFSGGNELPSGDPPTRLFVKLFYELLHRHDRQRRPVTPASGMHWERGEPALRHRPLPADYLDYHNYRMIETRWPRLAPELQREDEELRQIYGGKEYPTILGEWLAHGGLFARLIRFAPQVFDAQGQPQAEACVRLIRDLIQRRPPYQHRRISKEFLARIATGGIRVARDARTEAEARARYFQRAIEIVRRDCPWLIGYSVHGVRPYILRALGQGNERLPHRYGSPEFEALRTAQQPVLAIPDFWQKHILAEEGLRFQVTVHNATGDDFRGRLRVRLLSGGKGLAQKSLPVEAIPPLGRHRVALALSLPPSTPAGPATLELTLTRDGRTVSVNRHRVVVHRRSESAPLTTKAKVALYERVSGEESAAALLRDFGVAFQSIEDLARLEDFDLLMLGRDSADANVFRHAESIRRFIEAGGRMLTFEQSLSAPVPWAPALHWESCGPVPRADPLDLRHPLFRGLEPLDFEDWSPDHFLYDTYLKPLNANVLVMGATPRTGFAHSQPPDFGMLVAEFRLGRGVCLLSQLQVTRHYRSDSVARLFAYNLLRHLLSGPADLEAVRLLEGDTGQALPTPPPEENALRLLNLRRFSNRSLEDTDGSGWMGLKEGLTGLSPGRKLLGGVLFRVDEKGIVLGRSPRRPGLEFPASVERIGIWANVARIYFLHTASWVAAKEGEELLRYVFTYRDGRKEAFIVRNGRDLADWHRATSHPNARIVWVSPAGKALFLSTWGNPHPEKRIKWMDIEVAPRGLVGIVAITAVLAGSQR